jgi:hypothetical protein
MLDERHQRFTTAKLGGKRAIRFPGRSYVLDGLWSQNHLSAIAMTIAKIVTVCPPNQVRQTVIKGIPIEMTALLMRLTRADKSL